MKYSFSGHSVLVTGAASGIGAATARLLAAKGISHEIAIPDISSKEKAQAALGMDMKQMNSDKAQFLKTTVPAWDAEAKAAGRLAQ